LKTQTEKTQTEKQASIKLIPKQFYNCNIIPLKPLSKKYNFKLTNPSPNKPEDYKWKKYQSVMYPRGLLKGYKGNLGVILGDSLGEGLYLTQVDLDDPSFLQYFEDVETLIIQSGRGFHVYIYSEKPVGTKKDYPIDKIEIRGHEGSYTVIPPSIHPETKEPYTVYQDKPILTVEDGVMWVKHQLKPLKSDFKKDKTYKSNRKSNNVNSDRELSESDIDHIITLLKPFYRESYRNDIIYSLSGFMKKEGIKESSAQLLIERLSHDDEDGMSARIQVLHRTYNNTLPDTELKGASGLYETIEKQADQDMFKTIQREINDIIEKPIHYGMLTARIGTNELFVANQDKKSIIHVKEKYTGDKVIATEKTVIEAYPSEVIIFDSPLEDEPRKFEILWQTHNSPRPIKTGPDLLDDIKNDLIESGHVINNRMVNDCLPAIMNKMIREQYAEIKTDIETPGFFYTPETNKIITVKYETFEPPNDELQQALKVLDDLRHSFEGHETKIATIFKWGLISPFIYSMKQLGTWAPWLYLYGKAKSGKSTLGQMVLYLWDEPTPDTDLTGGMFDTVARVGNRISQSTFPVVVNEPAGAFSRVSVTEMIKGAIERPTGRGRYEGRRFRNIPAYAPVIFTANLFVPDDDALVRRFIILNFTHSEMKTQKEVDAFEDEWQTKNHKRCKFNLLKPISQFVIKEFMENPDLLQMEWKELCDTLVTRVYYEAGVRPDNWIYGWSRSESMEDMDEEHREEVRIFLLECINKAYGRVQVIDEVDGKPKDLDNYTSKLKESKNFKEKVWSVLNERLIPWMIPIESKNNQYVCLTTGFKKEVHKELKVCQPLKGIAELMGWKYQAVRFDKPTKVIKIPLKNFINFLYQTETDEQKGLEDEVVT
jgi:hypothetical protein